VRIRMEEDHKKEIEKSIDGLKCPKDFQCYKSGFTALCKARDIGLEAFLLCLDESSHECHFSRPFGNVFFCR
jgi:hypothetical protein